jgi:hypothetical protein
VAHAIPVSETQFLQISAAAQWLCPPDRDQFWATVAAELAGCETIGEGTIARVIAKAFKAFYRPIEPEEPQQLRKLTYGERKLEKKFDEIFDGDGAPRGRRQRSDAR